MDEDPSAETPWHLPHDPDKATDRAAAAIDDRPTNASAHATNPAICPFLHGVEGTEALGRPIETPDAANRCTALREPVPQSLRQQELVCLTSGHVNCPRYLRGLTGPNAPTERVRARPALTKATAGSLAVLVLAFLAAIGFVVANGGLVLTAAVVPTPAGGVLGEIETAPPTAVPTPVATPVTTPLSTPSAAPSATPTASLSPSPSATPAPSPKPTAKATPRPTSDRYALLKPCSGTPDCYVYVIRSGDNLFSIAKYFGVSQKTVEAMNPWVTNGLIVGRGLRIPTPTR